MSHSPARSRVPAGQERIVIQRSGNACAYPSCGVELVEEARSAGDQAKATGKVAHIAAASEGGPRYDASMTDAERGSAENLIYLCGPHHDVIDSQLDLHTTEFLLTAKRNHEMAVARSVRYAIGQVTYEELTIVCAVVADSTNKAESPNVDLATPIQDKLDLNRLGVHAAESISIGLSQAQRVAGFVAFQGEGSPGFGQRLADRFRADYFNARADGLEPDAIFALLVERAYENAGHRDSPEVRAAALAVIAYLFELCEIFEHA